MSLYVIDDHPLVRQAIGMLLRRLRPSSKHGDFARRAQE